jgi:hypothetical protein
MEFELTDPTDFELVDGLNDDIDLNLNDAIELPRHGQFASLCGVCLKYADHFCRDLILTLHVVQSLSKDIVNLISSKDRKRFTNMLKKTTIRCK